MRFQVPGGGRQEAGVIPAVTVRTALGWRWEGQAAVGPSSRHRGRRSHSFRAEQSRPLSSYLWRVSGHKKREKKDL